MFTIISTNSNKKINFLYLFITSSFNHSPSIKLRISCLFIGILNFSVSTSSSSPGPVA